MQIRTRKSRRSGHHLDVIMADPGIYSQKLASEVLFLTSSNCSDKKTLESDVTPVLIGTTADSEC